MGCQVARGRDVRGYATGVKLLLTGASGFIGTHLVRLAAQRGHDILNLDIRAPSLAEQRAHWRECDIMHADKLATMMREFAPECVAHLAARTDCVETTTVEEGYRVNTIGTGNVLEAVRGCPSVERTLITSTQFVFNRGATMPAHDQDFSPHTVYGQSKVISEKLTRAANLPSTWTIVRPTNVWGPWHLRQRENFFYALERGIYVHPGRTPVTRSYGYVGNVVHQMLALLAAPREKVNANVFYLGDRPLELLTWVNAFSNRLKGRTARVAPTSLIKLLGRLGDGISKVTGKPFLITTSRFRSMTEPYVVPMEPTLELIGDPPFTLEQGVELTASWMRDPTRW